MRIDDIQFQKEGKELWIIWRNQDHIKLYASDVKKLYKFLKPKKKPKPDKGE